ncbi:PREDICTED: dual specificity protein phosphatase 1-like isoform X2 [Ipomoea nil]|uniref:dual specificity protein phosphatase 1-like isoform X2 n=1 Tax=Ipomoea nil TaxID=35883 RepID=UPI0009008EE0|nr:PREDICTED: dual specificity protein phosphatase 1-like isoform X2 [Ipomoea nil]
MEFSVLCSSPLPVHPFSLSQAKGRQMEQQIAALRQALSATKLIKEDNVPCKIEEGLYLGSLGAANDKTRLKSLNITHILTVARALAPAHPNDFTYKVIAVLDREDVEISQYFDECFNFIEEGKRVGGVLVHCYMGRSRSVTVVVSYLMKKHGMGMSEALELVKSKRPLACPNAGFMLVLQNYEKILIELGRNMRGRSYSYSPSPPRGYSRRYRSPS